MVYTRSNKLGKTQIKKGENPMAKGKKMVYDNRVLRGHIVTSCGSIKAFALRFGISENAMKLKVANKTGWDRDDIVKAASILGISDPVEIWRTFFSVESWENVK
jgi:hypothetical protein